MLPKVKAAAVIIIAMATAYACTPKQDNYEIVEQFSFGVPNPESQPIKTSIEYSAVVDVDQGLVLLFDYSDKEDPHKHDLGIPSFGPIVHLTQQENEYDKGPNTYGRTAYLVDEYQVLYLLDEFGRPITHYTTGKTIALPVVNHEGTAGVAILTEEDGYIGTLFDPMVIPNPTEEPNN